MHMYPSYNVNDYFLLPQVKTQGRTLIGPVVLMSECSLMSPWGKAVVKTVPKAWVDKELVNGHP